jgi:hypothetical protein
MRRRRRRRAPDRGAARGGRCGRASYLGGEPAAAARRGTTLELCLGCMVERDLAQAPARGPRRRQAARLRADIADRRARISTLPGAPRPRDRQPRRDLPDLHRTRRARPLAAGQARPRGAQPAAAARDRHLVRRRGDRSRQARTTSPGQRQPAGPPGAARRPGARRDGSVPPSGHTTRNVIGLEPRRASPLPCAARPPARRDPHRRSRRRGQAPRARRARTRGARDPRLARCRRRSLPGATSSWARRRPSC